MSKTTVINNVYDLAGEFGIQPEARGTQRELLDLLSHKLYKYTDWGLGLSPLTNDGKYYHEESNPRIFGVAVNGIAEGTDIEVDSKLMFPFTSGDFWNTTEAVSERLEDANAEWEAEGDGIND
jgi:hypothetical protein